MSFATISKNSRWVALSLLVVLAACSKDEQAGTAATTADAALRRSRRRRRPPSPPRSRPWVPRTCAPPPPRRWARTASTRPAATTPWSTTWRLRDKLPNDAAVTSALTDLMPYTVIATEQSIAREDFVEAQRLSALIEKADPKAPSLPRLKQNIAAAQLAATARLAEREDQGSHRRGSQGAGRKASGATGRQQQQAAAEPWPPSSNRTPPAPPKPNVPPPRNAKPPLPRQRQAPPLRPRRHRPAAEAGGRRRACTQGRQRALAALSA